MQDLPAGDDGFSDEQRTEYDLIQSKALQYTTKKIAFVCPGCIGTAVGKKTKDKIHYFDVIRCKPCNAKKARYQRCRRYAEKLYEFATERNWHIWAITVTLGNDVEKRTEHTTVDKLRRTMQYRMNRMRDRSPEWNEWFPGGYQVFEHTEKDGVYHPHLHMVVVSPKARLPLKDKDKVTVHSVLEKFKFGEYVYVTRAYNYVDGEKRIATTLKSTMSAVRYAMKYAVKDTGGSRKLSTFGALRGYEPEVEDKPLLVVLDADNFEHNHMRIPTDGYAGRPARSVRCYWGEHTTEPLTKWLE